MLDPISELGALLTEEGRIIALQEPGCAILAQWREDTDSNCPTFSFRKFFYPQKKGPSVWAEFPESAKWGFCSEKSFGLPSESIEKFLPALSGPFSSDRESWNTLFSSALSELTQERAEKLVLARHTSAALSNLEYQKILPRLPDLLFRARTENAFRFLVKSGSSVFFGATPELLFERGGGKISVPAIAGTIPLSSGEPESLLQARLMESGKDLKEHSLVVRGILETLTSLGLRAAAEPSPRILRTARLLHLYTRIQALDSEKITSDQLIDALHPTAAIGGLPRAVTSEFLLKNEPWDRGLFASPLLFRLQEKEICLVGIRSALLTPSSLNLFAGAGVVKESTADGEWVETDHKLNVMKSVLFGESSWKIN